MVQKILIVEDDPDIANIYAVLLTNGGYTVQHAQNGPDALKLILSFEPHLILLDIMIPVIDGLEVLRIVRSDPAYTYLNLKIIIMTNLMQDDTKERARRFGAEGYVVKANITADELIPMIKDLEMQETDTNPVADSLPATAGQTDAAESNLVDSSREG